MADERNKEQQEGDSLRNFVKETIGELKDESAKGSQEKPKQDKEKQREIADEVATRLPAEVGVWVMSPPFAGYAFGRKKSEQFVADNLEKLPKWMQDAYKAGMEAGDQGFTAVAKGITGAGVVFGPLIPVFGPAVAYVAGQAEAEVGKIEKELTDSRNRIFTQQ